jgi:hypothetical protein
MEPVQQNPLLQTPDTTPITRPGNNCNGTSLTCPWEGVVYSRPRPEVHFYPRPWAGVNFWPRAGVPTPSLSGRSRKCPNAFDTHPCIQKNSLQSSLYGRPSHNVNQCQCPFLFLCALCKNIQGKFHIMQYSFCKVTIFSNLPFILPTQINAVA